MKKVTNIDKHEINMTSTVGREYTTQLEEKAIQIELDIQSLDIDETLCLLNWSERLHEVLRMKCLSFEQFVKDVNAKSEKLFEQDNLNVDELRAAVKMRRECKVSVFRILNNL
jgi:hypothetical protein